MTEVPNIEEIRRNFTEPGFGATTLLIQHPEALADVIELLDDSDNLVRRNAITALAFAARDGADISAAIPSLINKLEDRNDTIRYHVRSLAHWLLKSTAALAIFTESLTSTDQRVRYNVAEVLGRVAKKEDISIAIRHLVALLRDPDTNVQSKACDALGNAVINEKTETVAVTALAEALQDTHPDIRVNAATALGDAARKGADISDAIDPLILLLDDRQPAIRSKAITALGNAVANEKSGSATISALIKAELESGKLHVRSADILSNTASTLGIDLTLVGKLLAEYVNRITERSDSNIEVIEARKKAAQLYFQIASAASERTQNSVEMAGELADVRPMRPTGWNSGTFRHAAMHSEMARVAMGRMQRTQMHEGRRAMLG